MRATWRDAAGYVRFAAGLRAFLRETISVDAARNCVHVWIRQREERFLDKIMRSVYSNPKSPYLLLLREAGCEFGDVQQLVSADGLDAALANLRDNGVYVAWEEFKGRTPCRRGSAIFHFKELDFDNLLSRGHYQVSSGGTSGAPARMRIDLEDHAESAPDWAVWFEASGWLGQPLIFWTPTHTGMVNRYLKCAKFGARYTRWFATTGMTAPQDRIRSALVHGLAQRIGGFSRPWRLPIGQPDEIGKYLHHLLRQGLRPLVNTAPSAAAGLSLWALRQGVSLDGVSFLLGAEPVTAARVKTIEVSGARACATYGTSEAGWIGAQFPGAEHPDEVSIFRNAYSVIPRHAPANGGAAPLLLTGLRKASPKVLLNTEIGDSGVILNGGSSATNSLGYCQRIHTIRSLKKVTVFGVTLDLPDLYQILEESLPARFGGGPHDYQIVEDEDEKGLATMRLLVSPEIGQVAESDVRDFFLCALRKRKPYYGFMAKVLDEADAFRVERRAPVLTAHGKLLPVCTQRLP